MTTISAPRWIAGSRTSAASVLLGLTVGLALLPSHLPYVLAGVVATVIAPALRVPADLTRAETGVAGWPPLLSDAHS